MLQTRILKWPHRQGCWLLHMVKVGRLQDRIPALAELQVFNYARGAQGVLPIGAGGATSQLDLPSLTLLSVAACGRLQLGVPHWATSVDYCK